MSIRTRLRELESEKPPKLKRFKPTLTARAAQRLIFFAGQAMVDLEKSDSAVNLLSSPGDIVAALNRWTTGGLVHGNKRRGKFLDDLCPPPPEIWEIRITEPAPALQQVRLLGRFACPDALVIFRAHTRGFLGDKGSQNWKDATSACETGWNALFPGFAPFSAKTIHEYVTENCHAFPIKRCPGSA